MKIRTLSGWFRGRMIGSPGFKFQGLELTSTYLASPDSAVFSPKFGVERTSTRCRLRRTHTDTISILRRSWVENVAAKTYGKVAGNFPEGLTFPTRTSAIPSPTLLPP